MKNVNKKLKTLSFSLIMTLIFVLASQDMLANKSLNYNPSAVASPSLVDISKINFSRIQSDVNFFSSLGTRVTGYVGCDEAANYIIKSFNNTGLEVKIHEYYSATPIDLGSYVTVDQGPYAGSTFKAYALWPHAGLSVSSGTFSGKLLYAGQGTLKEMNGLEVKDSIVLLDFNSGKNWVNAAKLGAKGIIFIEPPSTTKYEALDKGSLAPLSFPRLYVEREVGEKLIEVANNGGSVTMCVNMRWENKKAKNIIGILEGEILNDVLMVSAHYDSWSIVPALAPDSEDAIGVSVLLELARYFKSIKPKQTMWFVAYSGHWLGTIGAVEFTEEILLNTDKNVWLQIGIDISSDMPSLDILYLSSIYGSMQPQTGWGTMTWTTIYALTTAWTVRFGWIRSLCETFLNVPITSINGIHIPLAAQKLEDLVKYGLTPDSRFGTQTDFYMLDTEPSLSVTAMAITLKTQYARRVLSFSPLDTNVKWENVWPQIIVVASIINGFANLDTRAGLPHTWDATPKRWYMTAQTVVGFVVLKGKTVEFSNITGWYEPLPNVLVRLWIYDPQGSNAWPFAYRYTFSDEKGEFTFHGLIPYVSWQIDAFRFNDKNEIEYVVDYGFYGTAQGVVGGLRTQVFPISTSVSMLIPLFKAKQVTIFDLVDTRTMRNLVVRDFRNPNHYYFNQYVSASWTWGGRVMGVFGFGFGVYQAASKSTPVFMSSYIGADGIANLYVKKGEKIVITFSPAARVWPIIVLSNSSNDNPEGNGYVVSENIVIPFTIYYSMIDMYRMIKHRYENFRSYGVRVTYAEQMLEKGEFYVKAANESLSKRNYEDAYHQAILAIQYLHNAYSNAVMPLYNEASISLSFFSFLIIPFAILFERVVLQWSSYKRFLGIFMLMLFFFFLYSLVHPALTVMSNSIMAIIGVGVLLLLIVILAIFITDIRDLLEKIRVSVLGEHVFTKGRVDTLMHTLTYSVENMRRRPLLTILALVSIMCFTAALTAFTSTSYEYAILKSPYQYSPPYTGLLVKNMYGMPPESYGGVLDILTLQHVKWLAGEEYIVSPRIWMCPQPQYPETLPVIEFINAEGKRFRLSPFVIVGVTSEELRLILGNHIDGLGIFTGKYQCILPSDIARTLNVKVGDRITVKGLDAELSIVGITDFAELVRDFDGKYFLPIDPGFTYDMSLQATIYPAGMEPSPVSPAQVIYIPWQLALERGGFISSIALIPKTEKAQEEIENLASLITSTTSLTVHVGIRDSAYGLRRIFTYMFQGWDIMIIALVAIIVLSVLNFMLGGFLSRKKDIQIYSVLGLSPSRVMAMFFIECVTLGFGGTIIGYLVGFALNQTLIKMGLMPPNFVFNFISIPVVISMSLIIGTVMGASMYPALLAAKIVTPSLERKWRAPTSPHGDIWELPLPLKARAFEALGILKYLEEYFVGAGAEKSGFRILSTPQINAENMEITFDVILTPVETNITQTAIIKGREENGEFNFFLILKRKTGPPELWETRNRSFIDDVRKQCLVWKGLGTEQRNKYIKAAQSIENYS